MLLNKSIYKLIYLITERRAVTQRMRSDAEDRATAESRPPIAAFDRASEQACRCSIE